MRTFIFAALCFISSIAVSQELMPDMVIKQFEQAIIKQDRAYMIKEVYPDGRPLILFNRFDQSGKLIEAGYFFNGKTHSNWYQVEDGNISGIAVYQHGVLVETVQMFDGYADCYTQGDDLLVRRRIRPGSGRWNQLLTESPKIPNKSGLDRFVFADL